MTPPTVTFHGTGTPKLDRIQVEAPGGSLVGSLGPSHLIADMFGTKSNPARWQFLRSLKAKTAWLDQLRVQKDLRRQGLGTELMKTTLAVLSDLGVRYVGLSPRPEKADDTEALERFYAKFGFEEVRSFRGKNLWNRILVLDLERER